MASCAWQRHLEAKFNWTFVGKADRDLVAILKCMPLRDLLTVHPCAIHRSTVKQLSSVIADLDLSMLARDHVRDHRAIDNEVRDTWVSTDCEDVLRDVHDFLFAVDEVHQAPALMRL